MRRRLSIFLFILAVLLFATYHFINQDFTKTPSSIFYNGTILTMEDSTPKATAIFVEEGIIKALGTQAEIMSLKQTDTKVIDLKGKTLMPGFIDPHTHPALSTFLHNMVDLSGFKHDTPQELWAHLEASVSQYKTGEWIICKGFDPILVKELKAPHISFLDSIAPNNPVLILAQSLHSYWANTAAFQAVGITKNTPNPSETSFYERDSLGELTGFIAEQEAFKPITEKLEEIFAPDQMIAATQAVFEDYAHQGNTTIVSTGLSIQDARPLRLYEHLSAENPYFLNQILVKLGYLPPRKPNPRHFIYARHDRTFLLPDSPNNGDDYYRFLGVKHWYDGSPYTGSMFLSTPYIVSDLTKEGLQIKEGYAGERLISEAAMTSFIKKYQSQGWQIAVHVQGDQAIAETIAAFEKVHQEQDITPFRHRLEHCLLLSETSIQQLRPLNMTPSMHINHLYYYGEALQKDILGEERAEHILPIASLINAGLKYSFHADQPMFPSRPFHLIQTAVLRQTKEDFVLGAPQKITVLEGLKAMTINAAWQIKMEDKIGSIKTGKYADLIVLDKNPLEIAVEDLRNIKVLKTYIGGNEVY